MKFEGKIEVGAPVAKTWDFLMDIDRFSSCMPGLEKVTRLDERTFEGTIGAEVGPISGKFAFRATIVEATPPSAMAVRIDGEDSVTKSKVSAEVEATLEEIAADRTELSYRAEVEIKGRLAILGDMILRATSSLMVEEFARRLRSRVEDGKRAV